MSLTIHQGDAFAVLRTMPESSVQCVVTSPPYYGLRDYGTAEWSGGDAACDHKKVTPGTASLEKSTLGPNRDGASGQKTNGHQQEGFRAKCGKCGALRIDQQIGLERTPDEYIARLVEVFREVRRVLRPDGVLWVNIGDSYAGGGNNRGGNPSEHSPKQATNRGGYGQIATPVPAGLKPKDLIGIPWLLAFALRADGWWLRQDVIWAKPNPMPESVKDRCTKSHEYLFMLTKSAKYFYDSAAIADIAVDPEYRTVGKVRPNPDSLYASGEFGGDNRSGLHRQFGGREFRNRRSVWVMSTCPTPEAHFATFPLDLAQDCILAGSKADDVVLDPFAGAGTTGLACLKNARKFIGIELNRAYIDIAHERARKHYPLLAEATA